MLVDTFIQSKPFTATLSMTDRADSSTVIWEVVQAQPPHATATWTRGGGLAVSKREEKPLCTWVILPWLLLVTWR